MNSRDPGRRRFLKVLVTLPVLYAVGWEPVLYRHTAYAADLSPEESLRKLIYLLGPWTSGEKAKAEDFSRRFLASGQNVAPYLPASGELVQRLAARFPDSTMSVKEVDLKGLSAKERELAEGLVKQIYSFVEVRSHVNGEPEWGECQTDAMRHTRPPA